MSWLKVLKFEAQVIKTVGWNIFVSWLQTLLVIGGIITGLILSYYISYYTLVAGGNALIWILSY